MLGRDNQVSTMLQDCQGIPTGFALHWSFADLVLSSQGEETALLPSAGSGISLENKIKLYKNCEQDNADSLDTHNPSRRFDLGMPALQL